MFRTMIFAGLSALAATCQAGVIYTDFPNTPPYFATDSGVLVSSNRPSFAFTSATDDAVSEIDFVTSINSLNDTNEVTITLSDDNGGVPGNSLISQTFSGLMGVDGSITNPPSPIEWILSSPQAITANTQYWVTFDPPSGGSITWNTNLGGAFGYDFFSNSTWQHSEGTIGAIAILDSSAPEPGTFALLGLAMSGCVVVRLKRRRM